MSESNEEKKVGRRVSYTKEKDAYGHHTLILRDYPANETKCPFIPICSPIKGFIQSYRCHAPLRLCSHPLSERDRNFIFYFLFLPLTAASFPSAQSLDTF